MDERNRAVPPDRLFAVEKLDVFQVALSLLGLVDALGPRLWRKHSALCRQLQRALASILANIGEAAGCLGPAERRRFLEYAYRSASECAALIIAFDRLGALSPAHADQARQLLHRIQIMLIRLIQRARRST